MTSLRVLNYNLWHGLNGAGFIKFRELEPEGRRIRRQKVQLEQLKALDADLIFLQEVNPLYSRSTEIAQALSMDYIAQYDQAGMRVFGLGLPFNLKTGLSILARPELMLTRHRGTKLSGGFGFCRKYLSFQYAEFRYALQGCVHFNGEIIQVINTHLHHGPVMSRALMDELNVFFKKYPKANRGLVLQSLERATQRRSQEVETLIRNLIPGPQILAGDLNVEPDDLILEELAQAGFYDVFKNIPVLTWDSEHNRENHEFSRELKLPVSNFGFNDLEHLLKNYDSRRRRVDYILCTRELSAEDQKLVLNQPTDGLIGSDHFGLLTTLTL